MSLARRSRWLLMLACACLAALSVAACGGGSSGGHGGGDGGGSARAKQILRATFESHHPVNSGTMNVQLTLTPHGSSAFKQPIVLSVSGPFQSNGAGRRPDSDYTVTGDFEGHVLRLQIISAGGHGYVTVDGNSYELPQADYARLASGVGSVTGNAGSSNPLGKLGIDPLSWLKDPQVAGTESIEGTDTTRVDAEVNTPALLAAVSKVLGNASSLGIGSSGKLPTKLTPAQLGELEQTLGTPTFSVWSANGDHSLRKLAIGDSLSISGAIARALDGLSGLGVDFSFSYGHINVPQTITAPTDLKPYRQLQTKIRTVEAALEYLVIEGEATGNGIGSASGSTGSGSTPNTRYEECIVKAGSDVAKLQKCSSQL